MSELKVFISSDFTGHYPVGTALVIVAKNYDEALALARKSCKQYGLDFDGTLDRVDLCKPDSYMICDGNY